LILLNKYNSLLFNFLICIILTSAFCIYYPSYPNGFLDSAYLITGKVKFDTSGGYIWSEAWIATHSLVNFLTSVLLKLNINNLTINFILTFLYTFNFVLGFFLLTKAISNNCLFSYFITFTVIFFQINIDNLDYRALYFNYNSHGVFGASVFVLYAGILFQKKYKIVGFLSIFGIAFHTSIGLFIMCNSIIIFLILYFSNKMELKNLIKGFVFGIIFFLFYLIFLKFFYYKINLSIYSNRIDWNLVKVWLINWDWHRTKLGIDWNKILIFFFFIIFLFFINLDQISKNKKYYIKNIFISFLLLLTFFLFYSFASIIISINNLIFLFFIILILFILLILLNFQLLIKNNSSLFAGCAFTFVCTATSLILFFLQRYIFILDDYSNLSFLEIFFHLPIPTRFLNLTSVLVFPIFISYIFRINNFRFDKYNTIFNSNKFSILLNKKFINFILFLFITLIIVSFEFIIKSRSENYDIHKKLSLSYKASEKEEFWLYIRNLETKGNFLVHGDENNYLIVKLSQKPNLIAYGYLDSVNYVPYALPFVKNVVEEIYNINFLNPPKACKKTGGLQCTEVMKKNLEIISQIEWFQISKRFNLQGLILPDSWNIKLNPTHKSNNLVYYKLK